MVRKIELEGLRFGSLVVLREAESVREPCGSLKRRYLCKCDCGNEKIVRARLLRKGTTTSCGCFHLRVVTEENLKHGHNRRAGPTRTYNTWCSMVQRCLNEHNPRYKYYGARGIAICDRWQGEHGFENFLADMGERPEGKSIDRINNDGNYEPGNCRWATQKEQVRNQRKRGTALLTREAQARGQAA